MVLVAKPAHDGGDCALAAWDGGSADFHCGIASFGDERFQSVFRDASGAGELVGRALSF